MGLRRGKKKGLKRWIKKRIEAQRVEPRTPTPAVDALKGEEEKEERTKKETGSGSPTQLPWTLRSPPTNHRDHTVSPFLYHPGPQGEEERTRKWKKDKERD